MAMVAAALPSAPATVLSSKRTSQRERKQGKQRALGDFSHLAWSVRKDMEFVKNGIGKGLEWANKAFRIPQVSKAIDEFVWLRNMEDPNASPQPSPSWPHPSYPGQAQFVVIIIIFFWNFVRQ